MGTSDLDREMFTFECQTWNHNPAPKFEPWDFSTKANSVLQLFPLVVRVHELPLCSLNLGFMLANTGRGSGLGSAWETIHQL